MSDMMVQLIGQGCIAAFIIAWLTFVLVPSLQKDLGEARTTFIASLERDRKEFTTTLEKQREQFTTTLDKSRQDFLGEVREERAGYARHREDTVRMVTEVTKTLEGVKNSLDKRSAA